ncbi:hypothetical protein AXF42_Ash013093 [Apostasia shenzhenica]|uniref:Uncharacterized protein n=1 Tax=Apostasia shenzhenica TaxID=1088818 RepID=A0A2I0BCZ6_9ASPA|nr:hypothetical protein AXF42_Ash013093 [Apostasia shenzhenica]
MTKEHCIAAYLFASKAYEIKRKSGSLFMALYFKKCWNTFCPLHFSQSFFRLFYLE